MGAEPLVSRRHRRLREWASHSASEFCSERISGIGSDVKVGEAQLRVRYKSTALLVRYAHVAAHLLELGRHGDECAPVLLHLGRLQLRDIVQPLPAAGPAPVSAPREQAANACTSMPPSSIVELIAKYTRRFVDTAGGCLLGIIHLEPQPSLQLPRSGPVSHTGTV